MFNIVVMYSTISSSYGLNYQEGHFPNERWFSLTLDLLLTLLSHSIVM